MRMPREVFEEHLRLRVERDLEEDLRRNYSKGVVLLTSNSDLSDTTPSEFPQRTGQTTTGCELHIPV